MFDITGDPDDRKPVRKGFSLKIFVNGEAFSQRVLVGKAATRHRFIDDDDRLRLQLVALVKDAPLPKRNVEGRKIARADLAMACFQPYARMGQTAFDAQSVYAT